MIAGIVLQQQSAIVFQLLTVVAANWFENLQDERPNHLTIKINQYEICR
jgi:plasmid maintenance system killer protein